MTRRRYQKYGARKVINELGSFRSKFEGHIAAFLHAKGVAFDYENMKINWMPPPVKMKSYTPDFVLPNGIIIEAKGMFVAEDRAKHLLIREQHPELDIRFLFLSPTKRTSKGAKQTYASWAEKHNFLWAKGPQVPQEWLDGKPFDYTLL